uniref:methionine adenosyltransferase 2 subunit beta n=1 Tax=Myxine glutinosa TaxID=7769 RepID=UPI00358F0A99
MQLGVETNTRIYYVSGHVELREEVREVPSQRALITGATGLLGRAVYKEFHANGWHTLGCAFRRARPNHLALDICNPSAVRRLLQEFKPHVVVHCAAERRADVVENNPQSSYNLNVTASATLAHETAEVGGFMIYISTNYVFDGKNPPYGPNSQPHPLNAYGRSKLDGEKAVLRDLPGAAILRLPLLYGEVTELEESGVTVIFDRIQHANKSASLDDWQRRQPTHTQDVAFVLRQMAEHWMQDKSFGGIYHWASCDIMTKYEIGCAMADAFNLPSSHLRAVIEEPTGNVQRPRNATLDFSALEVLGIGKHTPLRIGLRKALWPFLDDRRWRQMVFH